MAWLIETPPFTYDFDLSTKKYKLGNPWAMHDRTPPPPQKKIISEFAYTKSHGNGAHIRLKTQIEEIWRVQSACIGADRGFDPPDLEGGAMISCAGRRTSHDFKKEEKNETILCWIKPVVPGMNLKKNKNKNEKWCHKIKKLLLKWSHWFTKLLHRDKKNEFESWVCDEFGHERICQYAWSASSYKVEIKTKNQPSVEESACPRHDQTWARGGVATSKSVFNFFFLSLANNSP